MNTHKINSTSHSDFLNESRQDPITGDLIVEGDEIVFCKECKSAFLKSSWEYLNEKHCNQNRTLAIFPVKKTLNLKSKRQYFKAYLHSISDWKQFDTQLKTLPWLLSSLDLKEYKKTKNDINFTFGKVVSISILSIFLFMEGVQNDFINNDLAIIGFIILMIISVSAIIFFWSKIASKDTEFVLDKNSAPSISIEKDQIIVFMPYKEQKVTLAKHKIEEIELIPKEENNYKLRVSYKTGTMFFSMNLNHLKFENLIETLYEWSNTVRIDLTKVKFAVSGMRDYSYLYASLDDDDENPNLLLP
ncbi:hypothetical protein [Bernardetia sp. MNP-M8]|uniref:hypothetical protein n=1 Tax=Bernardetia sp. MNP-M8 TaxID=3127470 RepID=UPI0030CCA7FA